MFIGHFAVAFAAKRAVPTVSLGTLFVACELVDLLWPIFVLLGIETVAITPGITAFTPLDFVSYPWTHSLLMCSIWALALGLMYWFTRRAVLPATIVGLVVLSHWFLDLIVHRPDLPLAPGSDMKVGFGLWNSVPGTLALEGALFIAALGFYVAGARPLERMGHYLLWGTVGLLVVAYVGVVFGPPPPSVAAVAWTGIAGGLLTAALGYWIDHYEVVKA
jgi:membrane-bound metal-dependent hydrolase YbcI (DUF457 family)